MQFLIQGDFLTLANREDVLADSQWNITIRTELVSLFLDAIEEFKQRPGLEVLWYRYIPIDTGKNFFSPFVNSLLKELRTRDLLRDADGSLREPSTLRVAHYLDDDGDPLIAEKYIPYYYLSSSYNVSDQYFPILRELGVQTLSADEFINGLSRMSRRIRQKSTSWHETVCAQLNLLREDWGEEISALPIVPLQNGSWVSLDSGELLFSSDVVDIPRDLGFRLLAKLDPTSSRYSLFREMGVQVADFDVVSRKIIDLHRRSPPSKLAVISHAHFLFAHRDKQGHLDLRQLPQLYVLNGHGNLDKASDLYMDDDNDRIMPLSQIISSPSHFLHPGYLPPPAHSSGTYWRAWLIDTLGVNLSPRVIRGQVSHEFLQFLTNPNSGSKRILRALRDYWRKLGPKLFTSGVEKLQNISTVCEDGTPYPLSATALRRKALEPFSHLHFLLLDNPEDKAWDFLEELGVTTRPDGSLYLKWLRALSLANSSDAQTITDIYTQLGARFNEEDNATDIKFVFTFNAH